MSELAQEIERERVLYATAVYTGSRRISDFCEECQSFGKGCTTNGPCGDYRYKKVSTDMKL